MEIENDYFSKYVLTVIMPDGEIINVEKDINEERHWEPYKRLNEIVKILDNIHPNEHCSRNLPNIYAKHGLVNFFPFCVMEDEELSLIDEYVKIIFPFRPTEEQFKAVQLFYEALKNVGKVAFKDKPTLETELCEDDFTKGLEKLKQFISEMLRKNSQKTNEVEK